MLSTPLQARKQPSFPYWGRPQWRPSVGPVSWPRRHTYRRRCHELREPVSLPILQRHNLRDQWILNRTVKTFDDLLNVLPLVWRGPHNDSVRIAFKSTWPRCFQVPRSDTRCKVYTTSSAMACSNCTTWNSRIGLSGAAANSSSNPSMMGIDSAVAFTTTALVRDRPQSGRGRAPLHRPLRQHRRTGGSTLRIKPQRRGQQTHRFVGPALSRRKVRSTVSSAASG